MLIWCHIFGALNTLFWNISCISNFHLPTAIYGICMNIYMWLFLVQIPINTYDYFGKKLIGESLEVFCFQTFGKKSLRTKKDGSSTAVSGRITTKPHTSHTRVEFSQGCDEVGTEANSSCKRYGVEQTISHNWSNRCRLWFVQQE